MNPMFRLTWTGQDMLCLPGEPISPLEGEMSGRTEGGQRQASTTGDSLLFFARVPGPGPGP